MAPALSVRRAGLGARGAPRLPALGLLVAGALAVALLAGCAGGGGAGDGDRARPGGAPAGEAPAPDGRPRPSLRRAVGGTLMLSFHGARAPAYVLRILRRGDAAGVFLTGENVVSPAQLRALTATLRGAAHGRLLVAVDQEGGAARTVSWAGPVPAQSAAGAPAAVRAGARAAARELCAAGVDVDFAPVADVPSGPRPFVARRAYAGGTAGVAARTVAAVAGFRAGGVAPTAKHFPGLGAATTSTDDAPATLAGRPELAPFRAAIAAGTPLVMAGHARYPQLDPDRIASQSPRVLGDLLRGRLGFRGVVVTDSLEARAVLARSSLETAVVRSLDAGADLLLLTGPGSWIRADRALLAATRRSPGLRARAERAAGRVRALSARLRCPPGRG